MKLSFILTTLGVLTHNVLTKNVVGVQSLNFKVSTGDDYLTSHESKRTKFVKRDGPDGTVETVLVNERSFFSVDIAIGDHADNVTVLVDTGSSDLWVPSSSNLYCSSSGSRRVQELEQQIRNNRTDVVQRPLREIQADISVIATRTSIPSSEATIDCSEYGSFNEDGSSTFTSNNTEFYILYGDSSFAYGTWGYDDVTVGGTRVRDLSFAVANQSNSSVGVLGIGLEELETTNSGFLVGASPYTYANFPSKLVEDGLINKRVYSLFLNSRQADSGTILFGGVDHSKYTGSLTTVPLVNALASRGYRNVVQLDVTLSGVGLQNDRNERTLSTTDYPALLDSGTTLTYMPAALISRIASSMSAEYSSSTGYYFVRCYQEGEGDIVYNIQGKLIRVPFSDIVLRVSSGESRCALGIFDSGGDTVILGMSFLRSAYVVYDLDNLEISFAQANYDNEEEDIDVITDEVPSATRAFHYSSTWSTQDMLTVQGNIFTNSDADRAEASGSSNPTTSRSQSSLSASSTSSRSRSSASASSSSTPTNNGSSSAGYTISSSYWLVIPLFIGVSSTLAMLV